jgi:ubiquinone biosynthesis protein
MTEETALHSLIEPPTKLTAGRLATLGWTGLRHTSRFGGRALRRGERTVAQVAAHHARLAFQDLGPTFVKFGQVIASSPSLPEQLQEEFRHCLDRVPPEDSATVELTLREAFGDLSAVFDSLDRTPIAAGSIAQAFRAVLNDGRQVIVKVQRRDIEPLLRQDLRLMLLAARLAERLRPSLRAVNPVGLIRDFASTLVEELSFTTEARAMDELRSVLAPWPVRIPEVMHDLTSERVLVMEYLDGVKVADADALDELGVDREKLIDTIFATVLYSACRFGVFHGDMHAGNLVVVREDGKLGLLDFGITGRLAGKLRVQVSELLQCLFEQRWDRLAPLCFEMADMSGVDLAGAIGDLTEVAEAYLSIPLNEMPVAAMATDVLQRCNRYGFVLPSDVLLFFKSILYLDGLGVRLHPGYEVLSPEQGLSLMRFLAPETGGAPAEEQPVYPYRNVLR